MATRSIEYTYNEATGGITATFKQDGETVIHPEFDTPVVVEHAPGKQGCVGAASTAFLKYGIAAADAVAEKNLQAALAAVLGPDAQ